MSYGDRRLTTLEIEDPVPPQRIVLARHLPILLMVHWRPSSNPYYSV
ncbi:MAG: hypothetical protein GY952_12985 [Rhodobacteraceae bacterium]|nr:hypothetical protein [Paracoccaceae bacterium]